MRVLKTYRQQGRAIGRFRFMDTYVDADGNKVKAYQAQEDTQLKGLAHQMKPIHLSAGQYVVIGEEETVIMSAESFTERYKRAEGDSTTPQAEIAAPTAQGDLENENLEKEPSITPAEQEVTPTEQSSGDEDEGTPDPATPSSPDVSAERAGG